MEATIKIKVQKLIEEEISLKLPVYRKSIASFFKVYSEEKCLWVSDYQVQVAHAGLAWNSPTHQESNEEEFLEACRDTMTHLEELALGM